MKIATYNLEFLFGEGTHSHSGKEWIYTPAYVQARVDYFSKVFAEINADILLLQEVASQEVIQRIIAQSGIKYTAFFATPCDQVGNAVLHKQKDAVGSTIPAKTNLPVFVEGDEDIAGSRIWSRRDFVQLITTYNNRPLYILGIHIKANFLVPQKMSDGTTQPMTTPATVADGIIRSELFRFSQAKKAREVIDGFLAKDPRAQIVVAGDFNAWQNNMVFRIISGNSKQLDPLVPALTDDAGKMTLIDHVLLSKSLKESLGAAAFLEEGLALPETRPEPLTFPGSDHLPLVIELK